MIEVLITDIELENYSNVSDRELNGLLQEVRKQSGNRHFIQEYKIVKKRFLRKPVTKMRYSLYSKTEYAGIIEINFPQDSDYSINTMVSKSYIMTYFYGLLTKCYE